MNPRTPEPASTDPTDGGEETAARRRADLLARLAERDFSELTPEQLAELRSTDPDD